MIEGSGQDNEDKRLSVTLIRIIKIFIVVASECDEAISSFSGNNIIRTNICIKSGDLLLERYGASGNEVDFKRAITKYTNARTLGTLDAEQEITILDSIVNAYDSINDYDSTNEYLLNALGRKAIKSSEYAISYIYDKLLQYSSDHI